MYQKKIYRLRKQLALQLIRVIRQRQLTQRQAAVILQVSQPRVSALMNRKLHQFSMESLVLMLERMHLPVSIATPK